MAPNLLHAAALALRASSATICPPSPTCPQDDQCSFMNNGVTLQVSCATDFYGGDISLAQTSTLSGCLKVCSMRSDCVAASYVGQNCYLKSTLNSANANANVIGVAVTSREPITAADPTPQETCPSSFACPQNDGCLFTDGSRTLALECGSDFYGGDLTGQYMESLQACTQACARNTQCLAASFVGGAGSGYCYLKSEKNSATKNDKVDAVYVVSPSVQSSIIVVSSSAAASPVSSPASVSTPIASSPTSTLPFTDTVTPSSTPSPSSPVTPSSMVETSLSSTTLTPSTSSTSSSSFVSASTAVSSNSISSTNPSSSTPALPLPTEFCLRATTVNSPIYGFLLRSVGTGANLLLEEKETSNRKIVMFKLESSGRLVTAAGNPVAIPTPRSSQVLRFYTQDTITRYPKDYVQEYCTITESRELKCIARNTEYTWTLFTSLTGSSTRILQASTADAVSDPIVAVNMGVFYGDQCVEGSTI